MSVCDALGLAEGFAQLPLYDHLMSEPCQVLLHSIGDTCALACPQMGSCYQIECFPGMAVALKGDRSPGTAVPGSYWRVAPARLGRKEWGKYVHHSL